MSALADRYARGAMAAAGSQEAGELLVTDLEKFVQCALDHAPLAVALRHPGLRPERPRVVAAVAQVLGLSDVATRVLGLLVQRRRMAHLSAIVESMRALADQRAGRLRAHIVSAMALAPEQLRSLQEALSKRLGQPVQAQVCVDASLIGGMVCEVGSLTFDNSLKNQLSMMADQLGARAH